MQNIIVTSHPDDMPFQQTGTTQIVELVRIVLLQFKKNEKKMDDLPEKVAEAVGEKLKEFNLVQSEGISREDLRNVMRSIMQEYGVGVTPTSNNTVEADNFQNIQNQYLWQKTYDDWKPNNGKGTRSSGEGYHALPWGYELPNLTLFNSIDLWENGAFIRDQENTIKSFISPLKYINPSSFSHRKQRRLYSRWKVVFRELGKLVPEGMTLKESYQEHILPHLRKHLVAKKYAVDLLSYKVNTLYLYKKIWEPRSVSV